jgi:hypothetical protein
MADLLETALAAVTASGASIIEGTFVDFETCPKIEVDGTIDDFVRAAGQLGSKVVFVETHVVSEEEFLVAIEDDVDDDGDSEEIDLREAFPSLTAQNARIGERRALDFVCIAGSTIITKLIRAEWDDDFIDAIANAREAWYEAAAQGS